MSIFARGLRLIPTSALKGEFVAQQRPTSSAVLIGAGFNVNLNATNGGGAFAKVNVLNRRMGFATDSSSAPKPDFDSIVKKNKVVVFMKGVPDEPRCGFSNAVVQILRMHGISSYDSYDVLSDEGIRQGGF
jgi:hypothetical protein